MRFFVPLAILATIGSTFAQAPANQSICDKYTTTLLKYNNATSQYTLLTLLVNTVVVGNYTEPNTVIMVPGILATGTFNGEAISSQYFLTHLYRFFGKVLGYGGGGMANVHRFMNLHSKQVGYFIHQVGLAATSFGVATDDATTVGIALAKLFGYCCSLPTTVIPEAEPQLESIFQNASCPLDPMATCTAYPSNGTVPVPMISNSMMNSTSTVSWPGMSEAMILPPTGAAQATGAAAVVGVGLGSATLGAMALAFML
ncbi:hypothetical protein K432DRAFT_418620 [Lepidopterella palustris CBS 459.81]|uniref:Secreted protein n=1 Tax=Lepidopterella palustris CBS 459.81 TaxID=1314670 RepID=A0A8E2E5A5_9PEZI|nr:hypothetical protein K432DRAFT_418620 [Lepidopterella palustris CBS 459.81]